MTAGIVTIRFTSQWPWNPISPIIARLGGSRQFSHCMAIIEGTAYESTMIAGCRVVPVDEAMKGVAVYRDMQILVPNIEAAIAFGLSQNGKKYDWAGALGLPLMASENWSDETSWWCSDLIFMIVAAGGVMLLDMDEHRRVTPNDLHQCPYRKSELFFVQKLNPLRRFFFDKRGRLMIRVTILSFVVVTGAGVMVKRAGGKSSPLVSAQCKDGELSRSESRSGTCSRHGGVKQWLIEK